MIKRIILGSAFLLVSFPSLAYWHDGGTLHNASASEWLSASYSNRLATSADFAAATKLASDMAGLRVVAEELSSCITEAVSDSSLGSLQVKDVAALCIMMIKQ